MLILGIETSCDETCAAVVEDGRRVLSNVVATQVEIHRRYGGVVPEIASRAHLEALVPVVSEAMDQARLPTDSLDAVAVVHRPGLIGSLLVGVTAAKTLAWLHGLPLIGINHVESHIYAACLELDSLPYPCVGLIVSGGHTSLYLCASPLRQTLLGATTDDAAGEAFDKVASILGLPYPGGPSIDHAAARGSPDAVRFSRPWLAARPGRPRRTTLEPEPGGLGRPGGSPPAAGSFDFSFSGLKTAVLYHVRGHAPEVKKRPTLLTERQVADVAASFQECVVDVLVGKTVRAAESHGMDRIIVGGGVAANRRLRARLKEEAAARGLQLLLPPMKYCTDNAAMVAGLAYHYLSAGITSDLDLEARA